MPPQTNNYIPPKHHLLRSLASLVIFLMLAGAVFSERQTIYDQWQLRGYTAPVVVADLATQDGMTSNARRIYYVNHPDILTGAQFNLECPSNGGEKTIVLGCYHGGQKGITLLSVSDPLLNGVEQVTAAHEMLHAAYDRLSSSEKNKIDAMLQDYYRHDLHDARLLAIIDAYKLSEPNDVVNEMHSVFGTEISNLPVPLEQYYQRYFTNRMDVVAFAAKYQAEFTNRQNIVAQDDAQLATLKTQIEFMQSDLAAQLVIINDEQAKMTALRSSDVRAYNASVPSYNRLVDKYNSEANSLQSLIAQYNQLVNSRNTVALEVDQLAKELNSNTAQISK